MFSSEFDNAPTESATARFYTHPMDAARRIHPPGELAGTVVDRSGRPMEDAVVDAWSARPFWRC
jgi:protocatechuate 3,4-dioxygenase beta subunit